MPKIFVSYRRKSSEAITGRILDRLVAHYGKQSIFIDIDNILPGVDFRKRINQVLNEADIMIAVVGPKWAGPLKQGQYSIQRESDWVRLEVETALRRNALVIPVLVDGAEMPDAGILPDGLKDFVYRNAESVANGRDFHVHVDRLIRAIDEMTARAPAPAPAVETAPSVDSASAVGSGEPAPERAAPANAAVAKAVEETAVPRVEAPPVLPPIEPVPLPKRADPQASHEAVPPNDESPPVVAPGQSWPTYLAVAAAAVVLLVVGYGVMTYSPNPHLAGNDRPKVVAPTPGSTLTIAPAAPRTADSSVAIPSAPPSPKPAAGPTTMPPAAGQAEPSPASGPATPDVKTATTTITPPPPTIEVLKPTIPATPNPPDAKPPVIVAPLPMKPSCLAGVAQVSTTPAPLGGPFMPVKIEPNLADAKEIRSIAVSPTGREIATASDDGMIRIWDTSSFRLIRTLKGHTDAVYAIDYWIDGSLLMSASLDGTVRIWNPADSSLVQMFEPSVIGNSVKLYSGAFYPGTPLKYLASGGDDGIVRIWNMQTGAQESTRDQKAAEPDRSTIRSLSYAPNGSGEFVTAGYDGRIRIYLTTKRQVLVLDANARKTLRASYSPDSTRIVTAGSDGPLPGQNARALKLWTVKTQSFQALLGHGDYVVSASWSPDGKRVVSGGGGRDKSVVLWDADSGKQLASFVGHQSDVEAVAFFAGGSRIVSVGQDKTIKAWSVADRKEILSAVGFGEREYVVYTPTGCYSGSSGIANRLAVSYNNRPGPFNKDALFVPEGFGSLLAGR